MQDQSQDRYLVEKIIAGSNFAVTETNRTDRYVTAQVKRGKQRGFFKYPLNDKNSPRLINEASVYRQLGESAIPGRVSIPPLFGSGTYLEKPWLIREYVEQALYLPDGPAPSIGNETARAIIDYLFKLQGVSAVLPNDSSLATIEGDAFQFYKATDGEGFKRTIKSITEKYGQQVKLKSLHRVLQLIEQANFSINSLNHEDYKLWHFYKSENGGISLIDGEYANNRMPLHRDFAILYTSTFATCRLPDLAKTFFDYYLSGVKDREAFVTIFRAMSAWIAVAELSDAQRQSKETRYHHQLLGKLIEGDFS